MTTRECQQLPWTRDHKGRRLGQVVTCSEEGHPKGGQGRDIAAVVDHVKVGVVGGGCSHQGHQGHDHGRVDAVHCAHRRIAAKGPVSQKPRLDKL